MGWGWERGSRRGDICQTFLLTSQLTEVSLVERHICMPCKNPYQLGFTTWSLSILAYPNKVQARIFLPMPWAGKRISK